MSKRMELAPMRCWACACCVSWTLLSTANLKPCTKWASSLSPHDVSISKCCTQLIISLDSLLPATKTTTTTSEKCASERCVCVCACECASVLDCATFRVVVVVVVVVVVAADDADAFLICRRKQNTTIC